MYKNTICNLICSVLVTISLFSCEKIENLLPEDPKGHNPAMVTTYLIKEGVHSTSSPFTPLEASKMVFKTTFDSSAIYKTIDPANQADINKLYGISDCGTHHHQNSARFGWRWYNEKLEIHAYSYSNGKRYYSYITSVALNKEITYSLELKENEYVFNLQDTTIIMARSCSESTSSYKLFPYFGGDEKAPHDITILIEDLEVTN